MAKRYHEGAICDLRCSCIIARGDVSISRSTSRMENGTDIKIVVVTDASIARD